MRSMRSETPRPLCKMAQMKTELENEGPVVRRTWVKNESQNYNSKYLYNDVRYVYNSIKTKVWLQHRKMRSIYSKSSQVLQV